MYVCVCVYIDRYIDIDFIYLYIIYIYLFIYFFTMDSIPEASPTLPMIGLYKANWFSFQVIS